MKMEKTMEKIVALAKARGFVYPGSEIYGGLANTWDYGNLGVELKNNVKKASARMLFYQNNFVQKTLAFCKQQCYTNKVNFAGVAQWQCS